MDEIDVGDEVIIRNIEAKTLGLPYETRGVVSGIRRYGSTSSLFDEVFIEWSGRDRAALSYCVPSRTGCYDLVPKSMVDDWAEELILEQP